MELDLLGNHFIKLSTLTSRVTAQLKSYHDHVVIPSVQHPHNHPDGIGLPGRLKGRLAPLVETNQCNRTLFGSALIDAQYKPRFKDNI